LLFAVLAVARTAVASGQAPRLETDLSGARIEYDTLQALNSLSLSGLSEWHTPRLFARLAGGFTDFRDAGSSLQARGSLAGWVAPGGESGPLRLELGGGLGGSHHSDGFNVVLGRVDARAHLLGPTFGAWIGASLARAKTSYDSSAFNGVVPNAGVWWQVGSARGTVSYQSARVAGDAYPEADLALTMTRGALDMSLYAGVREWPYDPGAFDEVWAGGTAAYWVSRRAAIIVAGGKYPADVMQGAPDGQFVSLGLRLTPRRVHPTPLSAVAPIVFTSEVGAPARIDFEIDGVATVDIAGDWNGWQPQPLASDGRGRWRVPSGLEPGVYRFNLRLDGVRWYVPEGVPTVDDGFGGSVGVLIVTAPGEM
jgi:hypothetical protein